MPRSTVVLWGVAAAMAAVSPAIADIIAVGPGESIQDAIDQAVNGDEIVVAAGTYHETICFDGKEITLRSADGPAVTIIDADGQDTAVCIAQGEGPTTVLQGFTIEDGDSASAGGGLRIAQSSPTVIDCVIRNNTAPQGAGVSCSLNASPTLIRCTVVNNVVSSFNGGGLSIDGSSILLDGCRIVGNTTGRDFFRKGGGMYALASTVTMSNCLFSGNDAGAGGGAFLTSSDAQIVNCTFTGNTAGGGGGVQTQSSDGVHLMNTVLWGNVANFDPQLAGTAISSYCNVQGGEFGLGNIDVDPMFTDADGPDDIFGTIDDDPRLAVGSPCSDAGNNAALPADVLDLDGDADTEEPLPIDLDGNPRVQTCLVDLGAFESGSTILDCNNNGTPDICDIAEGGISDCNQNGLPDDCEPDCDDDGTPDDCEVVCGVDLLFLLDTSQSMIFEMDTVCADLIQQVSATLLAPDAVSGQVRITVYGITAVSDPISCFDGTVAVNVGIDVPGEPGDSCTVLTIAGGLDQESWGPATAIVADRFNWLDGVLPVLVIVSDEGPCEGGACDAADVESVDNARNVVVDNGIIVYPVLGFGSAPCVVDLATTLADETTGQAFEAVQGNPGQSYAAIGANLADAIIQQAAAACGDGIPDDCQCTGDLNDSGRVDVDDLIAVLLAFGSDDPTADIDGSGVVNVDDLLSVILNWGVCGQ